jgi:hypothetical protein
MEQGERGRPLASATALLMTEWPKHIESRAQIIAISGEGVSKLSLGPVITPIKNGGSRRGVWVMAATSGRGVVVAGMGTLSTAGKMAEWVWDTGRGADVTGPGFASMSPDKVRGGRGGSKP